MLPTIDEIYGAHKYGQHPLDAELNAKTWRTALEYGLLRSLSGQRVVFTGTMSMPRRELAAMVTALGGIHHDAVPAADYVLVHATGAKFGRKMQAAADNGMKVMSEAKFINYLVPSLDELEADGEPNSFTWRVRGWTRA